MAQYQYNITGFNTDAFRIEAEGSLFDLFEGHSEVDGVVTLNFSQTLTAQEESDLDGIMSSHPTTGIDVSILSVAPQEDADKDFRTINYKTGLTTNLYPKRSYSFGAVTGVTWYTDQAMTNPVIDVSITYNYDSLGFATDRTTVRSWYMDNGNLHPDTKVTAKDYTINPQDQLDEAILRRTNNIRQTNLWLIGYVPSLTQADSMVPDKTQEEIRDDGVAFYEENESNMTTYIETGSQNLEFAVRDASVSDWGMPVTGWFNADATSLGITGVSDVRDFIIYQLSNGQRNKNGDI